MKTKTGTLLVLLIGALLVVATTKSAYILYGYLVFSALFLINDIDALQVYLIFVYALSLNNFLGYSSGYSEGGAAYFALLHVIPLVLLLIRRIDSRKRSLVQPRKAWPLDSTLIIAIIAVIIANLIKNVGIYGSLGDLLRINLGYVSLLVVFFIAKDFTKEAISMSLTLFLILGCVVSLMQIAGYLALDYPLKPPSFAAFELSTFYRYYQQGSVFMILANILAFANVLVQKQASSKKKYLHRVAFIVSFGGIIALGFRSIWIGLIIAYIAVLLVTIILNRRAILAIPVLALQLLLVPLLVNVAGIDYAYFLERLVGLRPELALLESSTLVSRLSFYNYQLAAFLKQPMLGVGVIPAFGVEVSSQSEFAFYDVAFKFGMIGIISLGILFILIIKRSLVSFAKHKNWFPLFIFGYLIIALISGFGINLISIPDTVVVLMIVFGFSYNANSAQLE